MNIVIIGPSGSGKGTQAELLSRKLKVPAVSMGDLFREAEKRGTPEGKKAAKWVSKGRWVPTKLTFKILKPCLEKLKKGFILDGFPRLPDQCELLDEFLAQRGQKLDKVIFLTTSQKESIKRLLLRAEKDRLMKGKARPDETEETIRERLASFQRTINPILDYYRKRGILEVVDGERSIEKIHQDIMQRLSKK